MEIALARIDDRLIHGQVVTAWLRSIGRCDEILICDDKAASDQLLQNVLAITKPPSHKLRVMTVEGTIQDFADKQADPRRVLLITRGPEAMLRLLESGIAIDYVNLGGMGAGPGRKRYKRNISISDDELAVLRKIEGHGATIELKMVPSDPPATL